VAKLTKKEREEIRATMRSWMSPQASIQQRYLASVAMVKGTGSILRAVGVDTGLKINTGAFSVLPLEWPGESGGSISSGGIITGAEVPLPFKLPVAAGVAIGEQLVRKLNPRQADGPNVIPDFIQVDDAMFAVLSVIAIAEAAGPALGAFAGALAEGGIEAVEAATPG